jgi:hypothetical protein
LLETLAFCSADEVVDWNREVLKMQLAGFDGLVAHFVDVAADGESRRPFLDDECADASVWRLGARVGFRQQQKDLAAPSICHPHLRAINPICPPDSLRRRRNSLEIAPGVRL